MAHEPGNDDSGISRVLVVAAHPDDVDFGAAGTVAAWTKAGIEVAYCLCTSGEATGDLDTPARRSPNCASRNSARPRRSSA